MAATAVPGCGGGVPGGGRAHVAAAERDTPGVWQVRGPGGLEAIATGTTDPALLDASSCRACHTAIYDEWAASRHGRAWDNGIFRREYREQPRHWCIHCHAPTDVQVAELVAAGHPERTQGAGPLAAQGVSCAACHVRQGRLVARTRRPSSPHETFADSTFGGPGFCGDCHQFPFPKLAEGGEPIGLTAHPMQDTVAQHAASSWAATHECLDCHATSPGGHTFPGAHDPAMLTRALAADLCRAGDGVAVTLENRGAGHRVPTGDVHRHIVARLWRSSAPERLFEIYIGRQYRDDPTGGKHTTWDSTLEPGTPRRYQVALADLGGGADEPLRFELRYVYLADERPLRRRDPGEPASLILRSDRLELGELPVCATAHAPVRTD
jgi:hypothetical protein